MWICHFLAWTSSKRVTQNYLPIAKALANGFVWTWAPLSWASSIGLCICLALIPNSPMGDHYGSCRCGPTHTSLPLLLNSIPRGSRSHMGRPGCTLGMLAKSLASLPTSHFSVIPPGSNCLRILCFFRLKGMVEDFKSFTNWVYFKGDVALGACLQSRIWW